MQCESCGAPLFGVYGRDNVQCGFCGRIQRLAAGTLPLGPETGRDCPLCERPLRLLVIQGEAAEACGACGGILIPSELLLKQLASSRLPASEPAQQRSRERLACPACGDNMEVHPYYGPGRAIIDSCFDCRVIWLDRGELL